MVHAIGFHSLLNAINNGLAIRSSTVIEEQAWNQKCKQQSQASNSWRKANDISSKQFIEHLACMARCSRWGERGGEEDEARLPGDEGGGGAATRAGRRGDDDGGRGGVREGERER